jgi:hypothetical protein
LQKYVLRNNPKEQGFMSKLFRSDAPMALAGSLIVLAGLFLAEPPRRASSAAAGEASVYKWNVADKAQPLLGLSRDRLQAGFAQSLTYPVQGACTA